MRFLLRSKIHRAIVTDANLDYVGSVTIDENLLEKTGLISGEKVLITSVTSGARLETYIIPGKRGSGILCMNGPTAHHIQKGEIVIIMGFELSNFPIQAKVILVDAQNQFLKYL